MPLSRAIISLNAPVRYQKCTHVLLACVCAFRGAGGRGKEDSTSSNAGRHACFSWVSWHVSFLLFPSWGSAEPIPYRHYNHSEGRKTQSDEQHTVDNSNRSCCRGKESRGFTMRCKKAWRWCSERKPGPQLCPCSHSAHMYAHMHVHPHTNTHSGPAMICVKKTKTITAYLSR